MDLNNKYSVLKVKKFERVFHISTSTNFKTLRQDQNINSRKLSIFHELEYGMISNFLGKINFIFVKISIIKIEATMDL